MQTVHRNGRGRRALGIGVACALLGFFALARAHAAAPRPRSRAARVRSHLSKIVHDGESSLYLSGYAYHRRGRYPPQLLRYLNENAWGGGFGRTLALADGGIAALAVTSFQDSLGEWEYNLGYTREWRSKPRPGRLTFGAGLSAFVTSRSDFFDGRPFPAVVPLVSVEAGRVALIASIVPRLPTRRGPIENGPEMYGDVVYVFSRIRLP